MIMFTVKHSCFDGVSSVKFVKQFLNNMNEIASGVSNVDKDITSLELLPSARLGNTKRIGHSLFRFVVSYCGLRPILEFLLAKLIAYVVKKKPINPYYQKYPPLPPDDIPVEKLQRTNLRIFTKKETKSIIDSCKANGCTVTGAITAAAHLAFYELLNEKNKEKTSLETLIPFNNRLLGNPKAPEDYLCYFVYFAAYYLKYSKTDPDDFWMMAKESTAQIKQVVKNESFVKEMSLLGVLNPNLLINIYYERNAYLKAISNVISSYGVFNFSHNHDIPMTYTLNDCFVLPIVHRINSVFTHFVYTINGKLTWLVITDKTIPDAHAQQFSESCFNRVLAKSCGTKKE
ncbi:uncharacterized protein LOC124455704 isoform X1 [Xenia sp. Carnegie-2017]|uniref:uncharacterized protein LOC124455704 isoform X1 n=1 Tax=Xenia sp. Carnegie-2017 TaxID=2897299 RepID=UPI001F04408B|nr:uncharacterized protein LOC124455704 isoform X1 [Xenia sp. Carnegie-2017]XP_046862298.1 uncharacterized protein LOC124455704 isoform X1 [Xenia sp. Carnegie-2017]XP_046862299.1 uncharacterized protein LOC124455704 isoform X1 [Xenia sp. Carnegie-2017]